MVNRFKYYWNRATTFGKIVLVIYIVPCLALSVLDYLWINLVDMCDKLEQWRYKTFWLLKRDKESYERRNSNKS